MKHSSTLVIIGGIVGLVTADGWWWGDARPECADECYRSFRGEAPQTAYCTDESLAKSVGSCISSACTDSTQAVQDFASATSSVCSVYSGCSNGATQTLTVTRRRGSDRDHDDDDDDDDDDRSPRTTTAVITGCPDGLWGGWGGWGGWGWDNLDRDRDGDLDRDDWRDWCRERDGWNCRTRATTVTVTVAPSSGAASGATPAVSTAVQTVIQAISGTITQGTTVQEAASEPTGDRDNDGDNDDDDKKDGPEGAGASVNVHFAGLMLGLFVAVAGLM